MGHIKIDLAFCHAAATTIRMMNDETDQSRGIGLMTQCRDL
jgi:hypothetical protein